MADWLLAHHARLPSFLFIGTLACAALWETYLPRRAFALPLGTRWFHQLALTALGSALTRLCLPVAAFSMAVVARQEGWGLLNQLALPPAMALVLGVLVVDLGGYAQHRLLHAVPLLWRFHQIHHSDIDVDCGTALRHHPVEALIVGALDVALIAAAGVSPLAVLVAITLGAIASVFNHANVAVPSRADSILRRFVVTPDMHRIHHCADAVESNRNFANLLPWWDRLFATYQREPVLGQVRMDLGLADLRTASDLSLWKLLALPFRSVRLPAQSAGHPGRSEASP
jgi:sterol desaturase/sphingolipid hydroxylase (fatty acid hydroxylase superfamily)